MLLDLKLIIYLLNIILKSSSFILLNNSDNIFNENQLILPRK